MKPGNKKIIHKPNTKILLVENNKNQKTKKEYKQGFLVAFSIILAGTLLEIVTPTEGTGVPSWPMNVFIGVSYAFILAFLHFFYSDVKAVKWLSRVPASVTSIVLFTLLTLVMGLTKQNNPDAPTILKFTGLSHVQNSYTFLLSGLYLLTTLGLVILRRANKFSYKNAGFLLNHLGLWLIVLAGSLGAGDLQRINIYVNEGQSVWFGHKGKGQPIELPFTVKLLDFDIDYFNPKLAYIESSNFRIPEGIKNNLHMIEEGMETDIAGWDIKVDEFFASASRDSLGDFYASPDTSAVPVARIKAVHKQNGQEVDGYISSGGIMKAPLFLKLNERYSLAMTQPEPREYSSLIEITDRQGNIDTTMLVVNEPIKISGWNLYQLSYDERLGKWSKLSVIEAIRDPWLPVIYIGIFMVIAGAVYLFTIGKKPEEELK